MAGVVSMVLSVSLFFWPRYHRPSRSVSSFGAGVAAKSTEQSRPGLPIRLRIPAIKIDAAIDDVGLNLDGAMDVPKGPATVAWYSLGPRPGDMGNAVMAGHFGWKNNTPAVFDNLHKVLVGDKVYVEDDQGASTIFTVRELRTYSRNQGAADVFVANDGQAHLNLITCKGIWSKTLQSFSKRLVVFTDQSVAE